MLLPHNSVWARWGYFIPPGNTVCGSCYEIMRTVVFGGWDTWKNNELMGGNPTWSQFTLWHGASPASGHFFVFFFLFLICMELISSFQIFTVWKLFLISKSYGYHVLKVSILLPGRGEKKTFQCVLVLRLAATPASVSSNGADWNQWSGWLCNPFWLWYSGIQVRRIWTS